MEFQVNVLEYGLIILCMVFGIYLSTRKRSRRVPGPYGFPFLGNALQLLMFPNGKRHRLFGRLSKQHKNIFGLHIGDQLVVFLNSRDSIREAFVEKADIFVDRPVLRTRENIGIVWSNGEKWDDIRKYFLTSLRTVGQKYGSIGLEKIVVREVIEMMKELKTMEGESVFVEPLVTKFTCNIIHTIVFGSRYNYDNQTLNKLVDMILTLFKSEGPLAVAGFLPWMTHILPSAQKGFKDAVEWIDIMKTYIKEQVNGHIEGFNAENMRDFIDMYVDSYENDGTPKLKAFPNKDYIKLLMDVFAAATNNPSVAIQWILLYMIEYPDIQRRCREEIKREIGNRSLTSADKKRLSLLEATMLEIQRLSSAVPISVAHVANQDINISGYDIQKGTIAVANIQAAHLDENMWKDPTKFLPERFLGKDMNVKKTKQLFTYSAGPRMCPGQVLANTQIFLLTANILQQFRLEKDTTNVKETFDFEGFYGITLYPGPYNVKFMYDNTFEHC